MKCYSLILFLLLEGIFFPGLQAQENWPWDWGKKVPDTPSGYATDIQTDIMNNVYALYYYKDSFHIGDTVFRHIIGGDIHRNFAIVKYSSSGKFIKALDIYPDPNLNSWLYYPKISIDQQQNVFISAEFRNYININGHVIEPANTPPPHISDIFLAKVNKHFELEWIKIYFSPAEDELSSLSISSDDKIYLSTRSNFSDQFNLNYVNIFGQDSLVYLSDFLSTIKLDSDGNIIWHKDVYSNSFHTTQINKTCINADGEIFQFGKTSNDLIINNDTMVFPHDPETNSLNFLLKYSSGGILIDTVFFHVLSGLDDIQLDYQDNYYFTGWVLDTLIIGYDTIIEYGDTSIFVLIKTNQEFEPLWYKKLIRFNYASEMGRLLIDSKSDSLFFGFSASRKFEFNNNIFDVGPFPETFMGIINPEGEILNTNITQTSYGLNSHIIMVGNCKNYLLAGKFDGEVVFNQDTLTSPSHATDDYFIAKNLRIVPLNIDIGPDTLVCEEITLNGPPGFMYYLWNDSLITQSQFTVNETGLYTLAVAHENACWSNTDSVFIWVNPMPEIDLPADTNYKLSDTLRLDVANGFEHYLWSSGDTSNKIEIPCTKLGAGTHVLWLQIDDGPCCLIDSVKVNVIDDTDIPEMDLKQGFQIFPNPSQDIFHIVSISPMKALSVINSKGEEINQRVITRQDPNHASIDLGQCKDGIYLLIIKTEQSGILRKLIKN